MTIHTLGREEILEALLSGNHVFLIDDDVNCRIGFAVTCNDLWAWGSADYEELPYDEIENCYRLGPITWACVRRGVRPFPECEAAMRANDEWNEALEVLPRGR